MKDGDSATIGGACWGSHHLIRFIVSHGEGMVTMQHWEREGDKAVTGEGWCRDNHRQEMVSRQSLARDGEKTIIGKGE